MLTITRAPHDRGFFRFVKAKCRLVAWQSLCHATTFYLSPNVSTGTRRQRNVNPFSSSDNERSGPILNVGFPVASSSKSETLFSGMQLADANALKRRCCAFRAPRILMLKLTRESHIMKDFLCNTMQIACLLMLSHTPGGDERFYWAERFTPRRASFVRSFSPTSTSRRAQKPIDAEV